jgi:hypothetical protein
LEIEKKSKLIKPGKEDRREIFKKPIDPESQFSYKMIEDFALTETFIIG